MEKQPANSRLRWGRHSSANQVYLITAVTHQRAPVFLSFHYSRLLIRHMYALEYSGHVQSLAFVVMPDHMHWLIQLYPGYRLEAVLQLLKGRAAAEINRWRGVKGTLWQDGYHDHVVRREEDVVDIARYVVMNPVRAGLVSSLREYPHWDAVWI